MSFSLKIHEEPLGFVHPDYSNHVYKFKKPVYVLKQAAMAWFHKFCSFANLMILFVARLINLYLFITMELPL